MSECVSTKCEQFLIETLKLNIMKGWSHVYQLILRPHVMYHEEFYCKRIIFSMYDICRTLNIRLFSADFI